MYEERASTRGINPNQRLTRSLGIFTLIFSVLLILYVLFNAAIVAALPAVNEFMTTAMDEAEVARIQGIEDFKEDYETKIAEAETPEDAARVKAERELYLLDDNMMNAVPTGFSLNFFDDPQVQRICWIQVGVMLTLNLALFVASIGLIRLKSWGRWLAIISSVGKVIALVGLMVALSNISAPIMGELWGSSLSSMITGGEVVPGTYPPEFDQSLANFRAGMVTLFRQSFNAINGLGFILPIGLLIVLNLGRIRSSFQETSGLDSSAERPDFSNDGEWH